MLDPSVGVGQIKLGMTEEEVASLNLDLDELSLDLFFDEAGKCIQIRVYVLNNKYPILLKGHDIKGLGKGPTEAIFQNVFGEGYNLKEHGLKCDIFELTDDFWTFVSVVNPFQD